MEGKPGQQSHCLRPAPWPSLWFRGHFQHALYHVRPMRITRGLPPYHAVSLSRTWHQRGHLMSHPVLPLIQACVTSRPTCSPWVTMEAGPGSIVTVAS